MKIAVRLLFLLPVLAWVEFTSARGAGLASATSGLALRAMIGQIDISDVAPAPAAAPASSSVPDQGVDAASAVRALLKKGQTDQALAAAKQELQLHPESPAACFSLAEVYMFLNRNEEAIPLMKRADQLKPGLGPVQMDLGACLYNLKRYDDAIEPLTRAVDLMPDYQPAWLLLLYCYQAKNDPLGAETKIKKLLAAHPTSAWGWFMLSQVQKYEQLPESEAESLQKAVQCNPQFADAGNSLGLYFRKKNDLNKAVDCFAKAALARPGFDEALNNLGYSYFEMGQTDKAIETLKQALASNPKHTRALYNLGMAYAKEKQWDLAQATCQTLAAIDPKAAANLTSVYLSAAPPQSKVATPVPAGPALADASPMPAAAPSQAKAQGTAAGPSAAVSSVATPGAVVTVPSVSVLPAASRLNQVETPSIPGRSSPASSFLPQPTTTPSLVASNPTPGVPSSGPVGYKIGPVAPWVKPVDADAIAASSSSDGEGGLDYLLIDNQQLMDPGAEFFHYAVRLTSDEGLQSGSDIRTEFDPNYQTLTLHWLKIKRDGVWVDRLASANFQVLRREENLDSQMLDGRYSVICHLEDVRVGDVIDFAYTVAGVNPVFDGKFSSSFFTGFSRPVHLLSNILTTAPDRPVAIKNFNSTLQPNRKMHLDQSEILSWRQEDVPASSLEERTPGWYDTFGWVQISEYSSWKEVVDWGLATFSLDDPPEGELKAKIDEIAAKYASSEDRALAAIRFVQNDIRYLGIEMGANSYKPTPASQVCEHRFGDCKDKTQLCVVMLRALGINACPALVSTTRGAETENLLPSPLAFDHAIVKLTVDDRDYWIDVTRTGECGRLSDFYVNDFKQALLLRHGEDSLSTVSVSPESLPREEVHEVFTIKSVQQPVELAIHRVFSGASAEMVRSLFNMSSHEEIEKGYLDMSAKIYGQIKVGTPLRFQDFPEQNRFEVWQDYTINRLWTRENSTMPWLATFYPDVIGDAIGNVPSSQRAAPYQINYPDDVSEDIEIDMFDKWTIDLTPISVSTPNFSCNFDPSIDGKVIHFEYHYSALAPDVLPADIGTYADDVRKLRDRLARTLTYLPGMGPGRFRPNWIAFVVLGMTVLASVYGAVEIYRRRRARPRKPMPSGLQEFEGIRGWLVLIMIGNVIRIGWLARAIFMDLVVILDLNRWNLFALPGSPRYSPFWAPGLFFEMICNVILIALTVVAVILLAQSRALFPKIMIALLSLSLVSVVTEEIILLQIPSVSRLQLDANARDTLQALVACAIWIPYLLVSRRVKATCRG